MDNFILVNLLYLVAGMACGFINVLASSGSTITLPLLVLMGVPPQIANATNRLPILTGSAMAVYKFHRAKMVDWKQTRMISIPVILGTITGVWIASILPAKVVGYIITIAVIIAMTLIIAKVRKLLVKTAVPSSGMTLMHNIIFFFIGVWSGLIVLDAASLILLGLVLGIGIDLIPANAIKNVLLLIISGISVVIFGFEHQIEWVTAIVLSVGSILGASIAGTLALREGVKVWIVRILILIVIIEAVELVYKFAFQHYYGHFF